ncbi:MAG: hypothetical protein M0T79_01350 [Actinomycetota bacterium]|nr:hypothetical protein [Actinomycetota bacterium]
MMVERVLARIFGPETVELWRAGTRAKHRARIAKARAKELDELVEEQLAKVAAFESAHRE